MENLANVKKLSDGEFTATIKIPIVLTMIAGFDQKQFLDNEIKRDLAILLPNTEVVSVVLEPNFDLSNTYTVTFRNPLLKNVKRIETVYRRSCEYLNDKIEQFNVLVGVDYFDAEGKKLYT